MSHYTIVVPVRQIQELWSFLHPFSYEVWIWLLVTLPSLILALLATKQYAEIDLETLVGFVIRAAVVDDGKYMHKIFNLKGNMLLKLLGILWLWACLILTESYKGNLTAMLTMPTLKKTIKNIEDLLNQDEIIWAIDDNGQDIIEYLKAAPEGSAMRRLFDMAEKISYDDFEEDEYWVDSCFTTKQRDAGNYASICDAMSIGQVKSVDYRRTGQCNYYTIDETFFTAPAVMAYQVVDYDLCLRISF